MIEAPQGFVVREECKKAASQNGYRRSMGETNGWARYGSTTARGTIYLAGTGAAGPWLLALDHGGVVQELRISPAEVSGPGLRRYSFPTLGDLYRVLTRVYALGCTLPDRPLEDFLAATKQLPRTTEAERLVIQRVGQDIFRERLMTYWQGRCPLTGITDPPLLRASHIIPWADCLEDDERLNIHNGLLLSALWDVAFDKGLVTFNDDGCPEYSPILGAEARSQMRFTCPIPLNDEHRRRLTYHRERIFSLEPK